MTRRRDNEFRLKPAAPKGKQSRAGERFLTAVLHGVNRAGGMPSRRPSPRSPWLAAIRATDLRLSEEELRQLDAVSDPGARSTLSCRLTMYKGNARIFGAAPAETSKATENVTDTHACEGISA